MALGTRSSRGGHICSIAAERSHSPGLQEPYERIQGVVPCHGGSELFKVEVDGSKVVVHNKKRVNAFGLVVDVHTKC